MEKDGFLGDFLNLNWDQPQHQQQQHSDLQTSNFESAMSSIVSSPTSSSINLAVANAGTPENTVIRELIGRLGSICNNGNSDVLSPPDNNTININNSQYHSANTSCYTTPLNSPPKLNLSMNTAQFPFGTDPGFVERAARFSCFGQLGVSSGNLMAANTGPMQMQHMNGSMMMMRSSPQGEASSSPVINNHVVTRKRKSNATTPSTSSSSKGSKGKDTSKASEDEKLNAKRCKAEAAADAAAIVKAEQNNNESAGKKSEEKQAAEAPKQDYIHVRARRGQATDSHSLAERVRREKISERMKFLQDLVPGCNKVTGKAVMLDEIINYVQSLQRQVEFLSMKLATVNPRADINVESLFHKDAHQTHGVLAPASSYPMEATSIAAFSYANQPHDHGHQSLQTLMESQLLDAGLRRSLSMQLPSLDGFTDASSASQLGAFWEDDLQSVVQMGFGQNQEPIFPPQNFQGQLPTTNMKIEL